MTEIALNILDIVQNSIRAGAGEIRINVCELSENNKLEVTVSDNGKGIPENLLPTVDDPFTTSRTKRRTGFGLPILKYHTEVTGGHLDISSSKEGTTVIAEFGLNHIDRQPMGDIAGVLIILISANPDIDLLYSHKTDNGKYTFSTVETKNVLGIEAINNFSLLRDIKEMINYNLKNISVSA